MMIVAVCLEMLAYAIAIFALVFVKYMRNAVAAGLPAREIRNGLNNTRRILTMMVILHITAYVLSLT